MQNKQYFYVSDSNDPHRTLAVEEYILSHIKPEEVVLYLYTHSDSVIIGKNQNAWGECRHEKLERDGGKLARRISGGGAVFTILGISIFHSSLLRNAMTFTAS